MYDLVFLPLGYVVVLTIYLGNPQRIREYEITTGPTTVGIYANPNASYLLTFDV